MGVFMITKQDITKEKQENSLTFSHTVKGPRRDEKAT